MYGYAFTGTIEDTEYVFAYVCMQMHVYMYMHMYVYTHLAVYLYVCRHVYEYGHVRMRARGRVWVCVHAYA